MSVTVRHLPSRRGCLLTGLHVQIHNGCHQTRRLSSTRHGRPISSIPNTFSIPIPFQQEFKTRKTILFSHSVSLDTYKPCLFTLSSSSSTPRSTIFNKSNTSSSSPILNIARSLSDVIINQKQRIKKEKLDRRKTKLIISSLIPLPSQLGDVSKHGHVRHVNTDAGAGDKQASVTDKSKEQMDIESILGEWKSFRKHQNRDALEAERQKQRREVLQGSARVVAVAIVSNLCLFGAKSAAAVHTGSASMLSESIHSFADVMNECLLMWGIYRSLRRPDPMHPYGFSAERYAWALVSGVGIFFLGCGMSIYHGISGIMNPSEISNPMTAFFVLGSALLFEGGTMIFAFRQLTRSAATAGVSFWEYLKRGADPTTVQILLEDCAGTAGVIIAGSCLALSHVTQNPIFDPIGSISIGCLLGLVATFLIRRNIASLVETSMRPEKLRVIVGTLEADPVVHSVHDVKTTCLGPEWVRFKAEINFNGEEVTRRYIHSHRSILELEFEKLQSCQSQRDMEVWLRKHGRGVVEQLGAEVDRLEVDIKKRAPEIKHCDLEVL